MLPTPPRLFLAALALAAFGCANSAGVEFPTSGPSADSISFALGQKAVVAGGELSLEFVDVKDSRCPVGVSCVWAGHAAVTLRVSRAGSAPEIIRVGTVAPKSMNLPFEANAHGYLFRLTELTRTKPPVATVSVSKQ